MFFAPLWFNVLIAVCFIIALFVEMRRMSKTSDSSSEEEQP